MPLIGIPALVLGIVLTVVGLGVAAVIRSIDLEGIGALFSATVGLLIAGWVSSYLSGFIPPHIADSTVLGIWWLYAASCGVLFVTNTTALGVTALWVAGLKIRGFFGLLVAGLVVTLVEQSPVLIQLLRAM